MEEGRRKREVGGGGGRNRKEAVGRGEDLGPRGRKDDSFPTWMFTQFSTSL